MTDGFFRLLILVGLFGFGVVAFNNVTQMPPVIEGPPCPVTVQSTGRVKFWQSTKGWGTITSNNGERVYALWHNLAEGQQLHAGEHVMFDVDRSHSSGTPSAVNLTVCGST